MIIAIDGPAGSGKSTVAKEVAKMIGFHYLDTGAMYRSVAWLAIHRGIELDDQEALGKLAEQEQIEFKHEEGNPLPSGVSIAGNDVTRDIRTPEIDKAVSPVSAAPAVREALTQQQRVIGANDNIVMEGRDIGTVVFPDAQVKVFLTASPEERARRRAAQNVERGVGETDEQVILADLIRRDEADSTRAVAPLKPAEDATLIDTTCMSFQEVCDAIVKLARDKQQA